jgi:hypothetical protein
VTPQ